MSATRICLIKSDVESRLYCRKDMYWSLGTANRQFLIEHIRYGLVLNMTSFLDKPRSEGVPEYDVRGYPFDSRRAPVYVFGAEFFSKFQELPNKDQLSIFAYLSMFMKVDWGNTSSDTDFYGSTAYVLAEKKVTSDYIVYDMVGFGQHKTSAFRSFAKNNFKYYRVSKTKELGMSCCGMWRLRIEAQDIFFMQLTDDKIPKTQLVSQIQK